MVFVAYISIPAALGCTTLNPSAQSCDSNCAGWLRFDLRIDLDFLAFAMLFSWSREFARLGPVANG